MFRIRRFIVFVLTVAVFAAGVPAQKFAQQASPPKPANTPATVESQNAAQNPATQNPSGAQPNQDVVQINTQLVQVDAVVTDKKGRHVQDLTEADFELTVDGKKQSLTHFSLVNLPGAVKRDFVAKKKSDAKTPPESMPTRQIAPSEVHRTLAFIVDDLGLSIRSTEFVRETLRKFVAEQMQEGDLVAIIRTGNGLGMLEQFTSDKRILYSAIEKLSWNPLSRDMMPSFSDSERKSQMTKPTSKPFWIASKNSAKPTLRREQLAQSVLLCRGCAICPDGKA